MAKPQCLPVDVGAYPFYPKSPRPPLDTGHELLPFFGMRVDIGQHDKYLIFEQRLDYLGDHKTLDDLFFIVGFHPNSERPFVKILYPPNFKVSNRIRQVLDVRQQLEYLFKVFRVGCPDYLCRYCFQFDDLEISCHTPL